MSFLRKLYSNAMCLFLFNYIFYPLVAIRKGIDPFITKVLKFK